MNPGIELRHLRYFLAVAETENFTRAAERLGVSQPSVSEPINHLERMLGTLLFQRLGKRLRLTEAGERLRTGAQVVLRKLDEACLSVGAIAGTQTGHLDVGVTPAVHLAWVPRALARMAHDFPGLTVEVHERAAHEIETEVEAGRYDLGLGFLQRSSPNLRYDLVTTDEFVLIVPQQHPLAAQDAIPVKRLADLPLVLLPESFDLRNAVDRLFQSARVRPRVAYEINSVDGALASVLRAGIPTVLTRIVLVDREALGLKAVRLSGKVPQVEYGIIRSEGAKLSPAAMAFVRIVEETERAGDRPGR